jgi:hypothetical protein
MTVWERHAARQQIAERLSLSASGAGMGKLEYGLIIGSVMATLLLWWTGL